MAESVGSIYYEVDARVDGLVNGARAAGTQVDRLGRVMNTGSTRANTFRGRLTTLAASMRRVGTETQTTTTAMGRLMPLMSAAAAIKLSSDILATADAWTAFQNRLRLVTKSTGDLARATEDVFNIAQGTSQEIDTIATVYQRFAQNANELGLSMSGVRDVTKTVAEAVAISGASTEAARGALVQFGQALASGVLRGEEFNSVMEQTPGLARAIADGMGVPLGSLRALAHEGKITSAVMLDALRNASEGVSTQFATRVKTVDQAWTELRNSVTRAVGEINTASGTTQALARRLENLREAVDNLDLVAIGREVQGVMATVALIADGVGAAFAAVESALDSLGGSTKRSFRDMALSTAREVDAITGFFRGAFEAIGAGFDAMAKNAEAIVVNLWEGVKRTSRSGVNELINIINTPLQALGRKPLPGIDIKSGGFEFRETVDVIKEMRAAWDSAQQGAQAYDRTLRRLTDDIIHSSVDSFLASLGDSAEDASNKLKPIAPVNKAAAKAAEANRKAIQDLTNALYLAGLEGEALAVAQARLRLNEYATPQQIAQIEELGRAIHRAQELMRLQQKVGDDPLAYVRGDVQPLSGGLFDDQYARYEAEAEKERERYAAQLTRLRESFEAQRVTIEDYYDEFERLASVHASRMEQIDAAKNASLMSSGKELFGELADSIKNYAGESSSAYRAAFAVSKAFAIAEATLALSTAMAQVLKDPSKLTPAEKLANMASVAAAGGQLISAISGARFGGGRQFGGQVSPGTMYRVNEGGAPELLNTGGRQYLMMNQSRGRVEPMKSVSKGGMGAPNIKIEIRNEGTPVTAQAEAPRFDGDQYVVGVVLRDIQRNGPISQQLKQRG